MKPVRANPNLNLSLAGLSRNARALVGVSGGRDSVALLHALREAGFRRLIVCHLNHRLRGRASTGDARFVAALATRLGLEAEIGEADVAEMAAASGDSVETAARHARYAFFSEVARRRRCPTLFLAHHADDQVETVLFNLFRGAGLAGLAGMSPDCERIESTGPGGRARKLRLLRPMLGIWREEIERYVAAHRLRFREDASNRSGEYTRNRLRHELLPLIDQIMGREVRRNVVRTARILRAEEEWLAGLEGPREAQLPAPQLRSQPVAQQRRRILDWLRRGGVPNVGFDEVETVRSLLEGNRAKVNLPGHWHARRREKRLFLERSGSFKTTQNYG